MKYIITLNHLYNFHNNKHNFHNFHNFPTLLLPRALPYTIDTSDKVRKESQWQSQSLIYYYLLDLVADLGDTVKGTSTFMPLLLDRLV